MSSGINTLTIKAAKAPIGEVTRSDIQVQAFPNPSSSNFYLQINSHSNKVIGMRILDAMGKLVKTRKSIVSNTSVAVGKSYKPGIYYAEFVQDNKKRTLKIIKVTSR